MTVSRTLLLYVVAGALALGGAAACVGGSDTELNPQPIPPRSPDDNASQTGGEKAGDPNPPAPGGSFDSDAGTADADASDGEAGK